MNHQLSIILFPIEGTLTAQTPTPKKRENVVLIKKLFHYFHRKPCKESFEFQTLSRGAASQKAAYSTRTNYSHENPSHTHRVTEGLIFLQATGHLHTRRRPYHSSKRADAPDSPEDVYIFTESLVAKSAHGSKESGMEEMLRRRENALLSPRPYLLGDKDKSSERATRHPLYGFFG